MNQQRELISSTLLLISMCLVSTSNTCIANVNGNRKDTNNIISAYCKELIGEIDQITKNIPEQPAPDANQKQWDNWKAIDYQARKHRITIIEKLENESSSALELEPYIKIKVQDIEKCFYYTRLGEANKYEGKIYSMMDGNSPLAKTLSTELFWMLNIYHINTHQMHLSETDMQQIATFELSRKEQPEAGRVMAKAIRSGGLSKDAKVQWSTWIMENMTSEGEGYKMIAARKHTEQSADKVFKFEGKDSNGNVLNSDQLKGKVVLLEFWAFWCGYCVAEIPHLKELNEMYYDQGLRIVGVFNDYHIEQLKEYVHKHGIHWPQLVEQDANSSSFMHPLAKQCGFTELPRYILLDRDGKLAGTGIRLDSMKSTILKLLEHE